MKHYLASFSLAALIYGSLVITGYLLWLHPVKKPPVKMTPVPVSLSHFQMQTPPVKHTPESEAIPKTIEPVVEKTAPKAEHEPALKPKPKPKTKTKADPKKAVQPKPKQKPKPIPKKIQKPKPQPLPQPLPKPLPKPKSMPPAKESPLVVPQNQASVSSPKLAPKPVIPPIAPAPRFSPSEIVSAEQSYLNELASLLARQAKDSYPRRAKRRHWEGVVVLSFNISPNGKINNLRVTESSGRHILDKAALEIIQVKMNYFYKPFPKETQRTNWQIQVPIQYDLR